MITAEAALQRLRDGNARFVSGDIRRDARHDPARREKLLAGQDPFAIVVGCADSRVPVEMVFDQGLGDLFVVRVAGNVVSHTQLASIEFAAVQYGAQLVVVLGHTSCGAMAAAYSALQSGHDPEPGNLGQLVEKIRPAAERALQDNQGCDAVQLIDRISRENVRQSVDVIRNDPGVLRRLVKEGRLVVVGAEYSLPTGVVEFF
jgi:carbonic anhydrase